MSSFNSTGDAPTQRVPAWKRLGLKLKPASDGQSHDVTHHPTTTTPNATAASASSLPNNNRTYLAGATPFATRGASDGAPASDHQQSTKRARQDKTPSRDPNKRVKSVSFAADTIDRPPQTPLSKATRTKAKAKQQKSGAAATPPTPVKKSAPVNLEPALAYLRAWHTDRASWKFNKNHQTKLLEQVFAGADETTIPAVDINVFYDYIRDLQGGVRTRLRELASGVKAQDMEQGAAAFAAPASGKEMAERKQKEYEDVIKTFLQQTTRSPEKRRFEEVEYVLRTTDMEMQRRVVKRMRAEVVLDELSETESSETTTTTTTTTTTSGDSSTTEKGNNAEDQRLQLNDEPGQRTKRKRKLRTAAVEEDTSSESESENDSDSDTSSSGSSSSSSSGSDDEAEDEGARANEDSSSSSSSSSSESGSDAEDSDDD